MKDWWFTEIEKTKINSGHFFYEGKTDLPVDPTSLNDCRVLAILFYMAVVMTISWLNSRNSVKTCKKPRKQELIDVQCMLRYMG